MRTEQTLTLTSADVSLAGAVSGEAQSQPSFSAQPLTVMGHRGVGSFPRADSVVGVAPDHWRVDEHWTAVTAYLADLYLPNEG